MRREASLTAPSPRATTPPSVHKDTTGVDAAGRKTGGTNEKEKRSSAYVVPDGILSKSSYSQV